MLFINQTSNSQAAKDYFKQELTQADYYMKDGQQITGEWHGLGAAALGLEGPVDRDRFFRLCDNKHPLTGEQLTARMKANRRINYDFTFDAPKSVTLAYELGKDARILNAFQTAVRETRDEIEQSMAVRVRRAGRFHDRVTGNMVWAEFLHRTTRPLADGVPDPQLHIHAVAMNLSYDSTEGRWKAGEFGSIKRDATYYQAAFHARLSMKLADFGYAVERDGKSFRLGGIEESLTDKFSRRSQVIEEEAARRHISDPKRKSELGRQTRQAKNSDLSIGHLRAAWQERLTGNDKRSLKSALGYDRGKTVTTKDALDHGVEHCFERKSVVREKQLLAEALMHGVGSVSVDEIKRASRRGDVLLRENGGILHATTQQVFREEAEMVSFVRDGLGTCKSLAGPSVILDAGLSDEQRQAAEKILSSRNRVIGLRGGAGTGKTRMMLATVAAIRNGGREVFTFAPSAEASRGVLREEGFTDANTVQHLLSDDKLRVRVNGQVLWIDEAGLLSVKDTLRLFELAKEQNCRVILAGDRNQNASVARGDALRIIEEESGLPFVELKEVRRQRNAAYRKAVQAISQGDAPALRNGKPITKLAEGIAILDDIGAIVELSGEELYQQLAKDYLEAVSEWKSDGTVKTALAIAPTHLGCDRITAYIRDGLKAAGRLDNASGDFSALESMSFTTAQRKDASSYRGGLIVQFHQNARGFKRGEKVEVFARDKGSVWVKRVNGESARLDLADADRFQIYRPRSLELAAGDLLRITQNGYAAESKRTGKAAKARLNNGAVYRVAGFTETGDIRLTNGFVVPKSYGHLNYGYTSTSHASQGKTVDRVFVAMGHDSFAAVNREQAYVSISRGRESVKIYTDDKEAMLEAIRVTGERLSATELLRGEIRMRHVRRLNKLHEMLRAQRARENYQVQRERGRDILPPRFMKEKAYGRSL